MHERAGARAKRVLMIGAPADGGQILPDAVPAVGGMLIVMEGDAARAEEIRRRVSSGGLKGRVTVIGGDPKRMLYKLAGPFDVIVCSASHLPLRPMLEKLLATDGVLIADGET